MQLPAFLLFVLQVHFKEVSGIPYMTLKMADGGLSRSNTEMCDNLRIKGNRAAYYLSTVKMKSASEIKAFYTTFDLPFPNQLFFPRQALFGGTKAVPFSIVRGHNSSQRLH